MTTTDTINSISAYGSNLWQIVISHSPSIFAGIILIILGHFVTKTIKHLLKKLFQKTNINPTAGIFITNIIHATIIIMIVLSAISLMGIPTAPITGMLAGVMVGVSMSLRSSVGNLSSGIILAIIQPFKVDEFVDIGGTAGTVKSIELFFTTLKTSDGRLITLPNNLVTSRVLTNSTSNKYRRNDFIIGIGYEDDLIKAKSILEALIKEDARILNSQEKAPIIKIQALGDSAINLLLRYWTKRQDFANVNWDLMEKVKLTFDAQGINIPYPQVETTIKSSSHPTPSL